MQTREDFFFSFFFFLKNSVINNEKKESLETSSVGFMKNSKLILALVTKCLSFV